MLLLGKCTINWHLAPSDSIFMHYTIAAASDVPWKYCDTNQSICAILINYITYCVTHRHRSFIPCLSSPHFNGKLFVCSQGAQSLPPSAIAGATSRGTKGRTTRRTTPWSRGRPEKVTSSRRRTAPSWWRRSEGRQRCRASSGSSTTAWLVKITF